MKKFIFIPTYKKVHYGSNVTLSIYRVKKNNLIHIEDIHYNTGSSRGHEYEAVNYLVEYKHLPKKSLDGSITGYINYNEVGKSFNYQVIRGN
jgi:hypothetical protein